MSPPRAAADRTGVTQVARSVTISDKLPARQTI